MNHPDLEQAMRTLAEAGSPAPLPDAGLIWQRAAARARWQQCELATRSIRGTERGACIVCAAAGVAALAALRPGIEAAVLAMDQTVVWFGALALVATVAVAAVLVRTLLAEE